MKYWSRALTLTMLFPLLHCNVFGQAIYRYSDENGVQHFTNIPPVRPMPDMQVIGAPAPEAPASPAAPVSKSTDFDPIIEKYASDYQLNPSLIRSIIATESGFNPKAVSPKGARGLMQLMPATAARLGVRNSFDPEENIQGGVKHFRSLMNSFGNNIELSLAAYNAGENLVQRLGRIPEIKETRDYVQSITKRLSKLELNTRAQEEPRKPEIIKFIEDGILNLTNIPPIR